VRLQVTDKAGATDEAQTTIRVGSGSPVPMIDTPAAGMTTAVDETVNFSGHATVSGQEIPPSALSWTISAPGTVSNELGGLSFAGWSNGGARRHDIVVPAVATTLTANYS
jgi:hypothetical protein